MVKDVLRYADIRRVGYKHSFLSELENPEKYRDYFIFTIVRDIQKRLASRYRFHKMLSRVYYGESFHEFNLRRAMLRQTNYYRHDFLRCYTYRYEAMDSIVPDLSFRVPRLGTPQQNRGSHYYGIYRWTDFVDREGIEHINDVCADEFKELGYPRREWPINGD